MHTHGVEHLNGLHSVDPIRRVGIHTALHIRIDERGRLLVNAVLPNIGAYHIVGGVFIEGGHIGSSEQMACIIGAYCPEFPVLAIDAFGIDLYRTFVMEESYLASFAGSFCAQATKRKRASIEIMEQVVICSDIFHKDNHLFVKVNYPALPNL